MKLKLNPLKLDVNVHPTKREVHFEDEEMIIESISNKMNENLINYNNQILIENNTNQFASTPLQIVPKISSSQSAKLKTPAYKLDRSDSRSQKLDFFVLDNKKKNFSDKSDSFDKINPNFSSSNTFLPSVITPPPSIDSSYLKPEKKNNNPKNSGKIKKKKKSKNDEPTLTSILQLFEQLEKDSHSGLLDLFKNHIFVGCVNSNHVLIQHSTNLYLVNIVNIRQISIYLYFLFLYFIFILFILF